MRTALLLCSLVIFVGAQQLDVPYEVVPKDTDSVYAIGEVVANEFHRHVPALSDNIRNELSRIRRDISRQFDSLRHYMDNKLDRMERDAPGDGSDDPSETPVSGSASSSPEAMIRHNLAMAELRRLGADLTSAMNDEVGKLRQEFRDSLNLLRSQVENSTQGMTTRLQGEFSVRAEESVNMLKKVFFLTRSQMTSIQAQLRNISSSLTIPELKNVVSLFSTSEEPIDLSTEMVTEEIVSSTETTSEATTTTTTSTTTEPTTSVLPDNLPKDCSEAKSMGRSRSGVTQIKASESSDPKFVWCDQETDGGGWTVLLRRQPQDIQLDFRRDWDTYVEGFGDPEHEYWTGLETMYQITKQEAYKLRVDMRWEEEEATSIYDFFSLGPQRYGSRGYELQVGGYNESSTGGDALEYHNGMDFSTFDQDNDGASGGSCAEWSGGGGWWYNYCFYSNPTGIYAPTDLPVNSKADHFVEWRKWQGYYTYLSHLVMMIRPS